MGIVNSSASQRRQQRSVLASQSLRYSVGVKVALLLLSSIFRRSTPFTGVLVQHHAQIRHRHQSAQAIEPAGVLSFADGEKWSSTSLPTKLPWTSSAADTSSIKIEIKKIGRNPVDISQLSGCGSTFYANGYGDDNKDRWVLMQTLSGVTEDGREVVAVVAPGKHSAGSSILVEARYVAEKPKDLDWERAAMLPFLATNCLCPLLEAGFNASTTRGQTFIVTGGHGSLAPFVVKVLKAWGGKVCCVTTRDKGAVRTLGAESTVDFRKESYCEAVLDFSVVIDTLGREKEGAQRILKEARGAAYISLQPKVLKVAIEEGVLFGAGKILQYQKTIAKDDARTYFLPNAEAMGLLSDVVSMVNSKAVELGAVGTAYVGMQEYMEALAWPKDSDTGLRFGFPGKTNRSWGWLGGAYDEEDDLPWEEEEDDEDLELEDEQARREGAGVPSAPGGGGVDGGSPAPTGDVVRVKSREELLALTREGGTMVFVSSRSCRACKFLTPFFRKLARRQGRVCFGRIDASATPELARDLGLTAVPSFVTFRGGEVVTSASTSSKEKIEKLVEELLYD